MNREEFETRDLDHVEENQLRENEMEHKIEFDCQCESCKGTGLYQGMGEHKGFAVVCHKCKGTGKRHEVIVYNDFISRKLRKDILQVVETNPGICLGIGNGYTQESFGGISYKDWLRGKPFPPKSEMRNFTCPAWWYQSANYELKPNWRECIIGGTFSGCKCFTNKELCWDKFDKEHKT